MKRGSFWSRALALMFIASATCFGQETAAHPEDSLGVWKWVNFVILAVGLGYLLVKHLPPFSMPGLSRSGRTLPRLSCRSKNPIGVRPISKSASAGLVPISQLSGNSRWKKWNAKANESGKRP